MVQALQIQTIPIRGAQANMIPMQATYLPADTTTSPSIDMNSIMNMMLMMVVMVMMMKMMAGVTSKI